MVALGSKCPGKDFFCSMQDVCDEEQADVLPPVPARCDNVNNNITEDLTASSSTEAAVDSGFDLPPGLPGFDPAW